MVRRTAGKLGDGGGRATWLCIFPRPHPAVLGEAEVLQKGKGDGHVLNDAALHSVRAP